MVRVIHTADWHLGKSFSLFGDDVEKQSRLRQRRLEAVAGLGSLAKEHGAAAVLVAGDVFHSSTLPDRFVLQALDAIGKIGAAVVAIPGNHDHGGPGSIWQRGVFREEQARRAPNLTVLQDDPCVHVLRGAGEEALAKILAYPLKRRDAGVRLGAFGELLAGAEGDGLPLVGLVHAAVGTYGEDAGVRPLVGDAGVEAKLSYLALGDFHRTQRVEGLGCEAWYSGTLEPDKFPSHQQEGNSVGRCLLVEMSGRVRAGVRELDVPGSYRWDRRRRAVRSREELEVLLSELEPFLRAPAGTVLMQLDLEGSELDMESSERLGGVLERLGTCLLHLERIGEVQMRPREAELGGGTAAGGRAGAAAAALARELSGDLGGSRRRVVLSALERLHSLLRSGGG
mgnify:CR=1 FL=1